MTTTELQTARDALYTQYIAWIGAGCPASYSIDGRSFTRCSADFWLKQINALDAALAAASGGTFLASQFRRPE